MSSHATESLMSPRKSWLGKHRKRRLEAATYHAAKSLRTHLLPAVFLLNISGTPGSTRHCSCTQPTPAQPELHAPDCRQEACVWQSSSCQ